MTPRRRGASFLAAFWEFTRRSEEIGAEGKARESLAPDTKPRSIDAASGQSKGLDATHRWLALRENHLAECEKLPIGMV